MRSLQCCPQIDILTFCLLAWQDKRHIERGNIIHGMVSGITFFMPVLQKQKRCLQSQSYPPISPSCDSQFFGLPCGLHTVSEESCLQSVLGLEGCLASHWNALKSSLMTNGFSRPCEGMWFQLMCSGAFWPCLLCNVYVFSNKAPEFCQQDRGPNELLRSVTCLSFISL